MRRVLALVVPLLALVLLAGRAAAQGAPPRVHRVQAGETLDAIAARYAVPGGRGVLVRLNGLVRPYRLRPGTGLLVPDLGERTADLPAHRPRAPFGGTFEPCPLRPWPPATAGAGGAAGRACAEGEGGLRVCVSGPGADRALRLRLERGASVLHEWAAVVAGGADGADGAIRAADGDLDGDGDPELVAAVHQGGSSWRVAVFDAPEQGPLLLDLDDYGESAWVRREDGDGCDLLETAWRPLEDPLRGGARYFTGRRWRVERGALAAPSDAPLLARRLSAAPAGDGRGAAARPHPLAGEDVVIWPDDELLGPPGPARSGRITAAAALSPGEGRGLRLDVALRSETLVARTAGGAGAGTPVLLGDDATERIFPPGYVPADPAALVGRAVRVVPYEPPGAAATQVVWLAAP